MVSLHWVALRIEDTLLIGFCGKQSVYDAALGPTRPLIRGIPSKNTPLTLSLFDYLAFFGLLAGLNIAYISVHNLDSNINSEP